MMLTRHPQLTASLPARAVPCTAGALVIRWNPSAWTGETVRYPGVMFRQVLSRSQVRREQKKRSFG
jgi:hypothetical protein